MAESSPSQEARRAHIELAFRYETAAAEGALAAQDQSEDPSSARIDREPTQRGARQRLGQAFSIAFRLPVSGAFTDLVSALQDPDQ
jgi:hypothetical protein